jgi:hypothetical protein
MSEQSAVLEATPSVMEVERGPLVNLTSDERSEFRRTGELPKVEDKPKTEEAASSSDAPPEKEEAKPAGESEPPKKQEHTKGKLTAEERIAQLESTIEKIRKGAGLEKTQEKAESSPAKPEPVRELPPTRPKPMQDGNGPDGKPYATYEDYIEDLADWKAEQREAKNQREQREQAQAREFNAKVDEARGRYENFDEVKEKFVNAISEPGTDPVVHAMLNESEYLPDLVYTIGGNEDNLENFKTMAKKSPGKALRYIALTESLIAEELEGKAKPAEEPAKPKTQAPRPPSEAGGRAAAPPDGLEAAAKAGDFRAFKAEATRRQLARLKS